MAARSDEDTVRLFQYGSNMARDRFVQRIKENYDHAPEGTPVVVKLLGRARLEGWRLQANLWSATRARRGAEARVANVVKASGQEVWGALYEIAAGLVICCDGERSVVDLLEGHRTTKDPENYAKICVTVDLDGEPRTAWTYIGLREAIERCEQDHPGTACDRDYAETVIAGAKSIGVPDDYVGALREALRLPELADLS